MFKKLLDKVRVSWNIYFRYPFKNPFLWILIVFIIISLATYIINSKNIDNTIFSVFIGLLISLFASIYVVEIYYYKSLDFSELINIILSISNEVFTVVITEIFIEDSKDCLPNENGVIITFNNLHNYTEYLNNKLSSGIVVKSYLGCSKLFDKYIKLFRKLEKYQYIKKEINMENIFTFFSYHKVEIDICKKFFKLNKKNHDYNPSIPFINLNCKYYDNKNLFKDFTNEIKNLNRLNYDLKGQNIKSKLVFSYTPIKRENEFKNYIKDDLSYDSFTIKN